MVNLGSRLWDWIVRDSICAQIDQSSGTLVGILIDSENNPSMEQVAI